MLAELFVNVIDDLKSTLTGIPSDQISDLYDEITKANAIFVCGAGRSLLVVRGFAMRLMHLGLKAYVVGDTTTPAYKPSDLLIVVSGSGETSTLVSIATKAKKIGGRVFLMTTRNQSTLADLADKKLVIPAFTDKVKDESLRRMSLPGGSIFEESVLILGDTLIVPLSEKYGVATDKAFDLHANLE